MTIRETSLPGVLVVEPRVFGDARGYFLETYRQDCFAEAGIDQAFVQDNESFSGHGILRGLHYQWPKPQGKLLRVLRGTIYDVAVDIRHGSETFGQWVGVELSAENKHQLWVPPGFAHGFCVSSEDAIVVYKCTDYYAPDCEHTLLWNDPAIGIQWPIAEPLLSAKDVAGLPLAEIASEHLPS
jgi:dTDP-4-dehydrorhamnose 3,5-epimerase